MASRLTFLFVLSAVASTTLANTASSTLFGSSQPVAPPPPRLTVPPPAVAFLRARCATTPYLVTCYDSLMPYGCAFQTSHVKLARAATDVNHLRLSVLSKRVKELVAIGGAGVAADALRDCASTTSSAAGLARQSAAELAKLDNAGAKAGRGEVRWAISNAQTWLSAAMTNEATCADGLQPAGAPASREVVTGIASTKEHTSIALALVKGIPLPP